MLRKKHPRYKGFTKSMLRRLLPGTERPYYRKVWSIERSNLIGYWPLWEAAAVTAKDISGNSADGGYTVGTIGEPGIGDGHTCPAFDGTNDFVNVYSVTLRDAFDGGEGTTSAWAKVSDAGVWTDAANRVVVNLNVDANNYAQIYKPTTNNTIRGRYRAGGTIELVNDTTTTTDWIHLAITWSATADAFKFFTNGRKIGSATSGLGVWVGNLGATTTCIGVDNTAPAMVWDGWIAHVAVWSTRLTEKQVLWLSSR